MYWLMRPVVGWGAFLLIHAVAVPLVYGWGKAKGARVRGDGTMPASEPPAKNEAGL